MSHPVNLSVDYSNPLLVEGYVQAAQESRITLYNTQPSKVIYQGSEIPYSIEGSDITFTVSGKGEFLIELSESAETVEDMPSEFFVSAPYPNPFNPYTVIRYVLPIDCNVKMEIYDILGRKVTTLKDGMVSAGIHETAWDGKNREGSTVGSGVYFYHFKASDYTRNGKVMFLR